MELVKKFGVKALCALALVALFLPMATIELSASGLVNYSKSTSLSGLTVALQGYVCMLLIVGPAAIIAADYIAVVKKLRALVQAGVAVLGIILTFVGYAQASDIAAAGSAAGMGQVKVEASLDIGGILCLVAYVGILVLTILWQKQELMENIAQLKSKK